MSRPKQRKGGRVTPKKDGAAPRSSAGVPPPSVPYGTYNDAPLSDEWQEASDDGELADGIQGLIAAAGDAIASGHPAELLVLTSSVVAAVGDGEIPGEDASFTWASVVDELSGSVRPETTALLYALRPLAPEEYGWGITAELARRSTPGLPAWISSIGEVEVTGVRLHPESTDETDVFVLTRWPTGQEMTFIVNVARRPEPVVQDAILAPADVTALPVATEAQAPMELVEVDLADARAFLEAAAQRWESTTIDEETEDWPSTRPLLRWLLSTLPEGGEERWPGLQA
ncbi:hypothetical protein [Dermatobacter hominis]|uniref:hypothetical protein n=1 Tax=Dermatobacter hominis TaxID=2884263 RepID=UPI001D1077AE|nr:hypothetical protein [Dermatobacter hominis]UDY34520.1 hypothetical protein LH044_14385 [Dermatobacter hominis]